MTSRISKSHRSIHTINGSGYIDTYSPISKATVRVHTTKGNRVSFSNGIDTQVHYISSTSSVIDCYTDINGRIFITSNKPISITIKNIVKCPVGGKIGVYIHGRIGDMLLAAGYIQTMIDEYPTVKDICLVHGGAQENLGLVFDESARSLFTEIYRTDGTFINSRKNAIKKMKIGYRKNFIFLGPPGAIGSDFPHINNNSIIPNKWTIPFWIHKYLNSEQNDTISIFRYSGSDRGNKSLNIIQSRKIHSILDKHGMSGTLYGYDDPMGVDGFNNKIKKLSVLDSIRHMYSSKLVITIDSWPATIMPRLGVKTILLTKNVYQNIARTHFHNTNNISFINIDNNKWEEELERKVKNI